MGVFIAMLEQGKLSMTVSAADIQTDSLSMSRLQCMAELCRRDTIKVSESLFSVYSFKIRSVCCSVS